MQKQPPAGADPGPLLGAGQLNVGGLTKRWQAPTADAYGRTPWQALGGVWDTRPDECQPLEALKALHPQRAPGGLVLRTQYMASNGLGTRFAPFGAFALQLCVAAWDTLPRERELTRWAGPKTIPGDDAEWPFPERYNEADEADRVKLWACRNAARIVLDVAPYLATPGAEIDLGELSGGARYLIVFWRAVSVLRGGLDPDTNDDLRLVRMAIPWTLHGGRALHPVHRDRWFLTIATDTCSHAAPAPSALFDSPARMIGGWSPPIAGAAAIRVTNGSAYPIVAGAEEWAGGGTQRKAATWAQSTSYAAKVAMDHPTRGLLGLFAAYDNAADNQPAPALYHLEVGR